MSKRRFLLVVLGAFFLAAYRLGAQSAEFLDDLMFAEEATFGQASILVLMANGIDEAGEDQDLATQMVVRADWIAGPKEPGMPVTLGDYSLMIMSAFQIPGGLGYRLFHSPRYAARELDYLGLVQGYASPRRILSGQDLLQILGSVMAWLEEHA